MRFFTLSTQKIGIKDIDIVHTIAKLFLLLCQHLNKTHLIYLIGRKVFKINPVSVAEDIQYRQQHKREGTS